MSSIPSEDMFGYSIRIARLSEEDGGGWIAEIPELPGCFSDGETPDEALQSVSNLISFWIQSAEEDGRPIPQPMERIHAQYSGKFTIRVARTLHRAMALAAEAEGISLNQYVATLLSVGLGERLGAVQPSFIENSCSRMRPRTQRIVEARTVFTKEIITMDGENLYDNQDVLRFLPENDRRGLSVQ